MNFLISLFYILSNTKSIHRDWYASVPFELVTNTTTLNHGEAPLNTLPLSSLEGFFFCSWICIWVVMCLLWYSSMLKWRLFQKSSSSVTCWFWGGWSRCFCAFEFVMWVSIEPTRLEVGYIEGPCVISLSTFFI